MIKKPPQPRRELQAHLIATRITPKAEGPSGERIKERSEGPQDLVSIIEREIAKLRDGKPHG